MLEQHFQEQLGCRTPYAKGTRTVSTPESFHIQGCVSLAQCSPKLVQDSCTSASLSLRYPVYTAKHFILNKAPQEVGGCSDEAVQG